jgi:adenosylcobyric acid synthase
MLGRLIADPLHSESAVESTSGLGLLPVDTVFAADKTTHQARGEICGGPGWLAGCTGQAVRGYEIHMGRTSGSDPWLRLTERSGGSVSAMDGSASADGRIWGCYLHGIFENAPFRRAWLSSLGWQSRDTAGAVAGLDANLDRLADVVEAAINMPYLETLWQS